jgi:pimeloyl-ACP methyl ester carboxylesterase
MPSMAKARPTAPGPLATGWAQLKRGEWEAARSSFEHALTLDEAPEALEGLSWAAWWMNDAEDVRDVLPHIDIPTLLVYGDRDVRAPLTVAEALRAAISGSRLVGLPDAGHVCNVEAPNEFNDAVRDFLHGSRG